MADTPSANAGETVVVDDSKTTVPVTAPATVTSNDGEVEKLRKEKEQAEMRANQLANQLKAREEADAEAKAKELEEQNKFKDLYEQERTKREAIESEREEAERKAELAKAKQDALSDYPDTVKTMAEKLGLDLTDSSETAVEEFKSKLNELKNGVGNTAKVSGNNQPNSSDNKGEMSADDLKIGLSDEKTFHEIVTSRFPGIASMTKQKN